YLRDRIARESTVEVLLGREVRSISGDDHLEQIEVQDNASGERRTLVAGALVILIGATPHTGWLQNRITLDADGFVLTGTSLGTLPRHWPPRSRAGDPPRPRPLPPGEEQAGCIPRRRRPLRRNTKGGPRRRRRRDGRPPRRRTPRPHKLPAREVDGSHRLEVSLERITEPALERLGAERGERCSSDARRAGSQARPRRPLSE